MSIKFVRLADVARRLGVTRQSVFIQAKRGTYPPFLKVGERAVGVLESEMQEMLRARLRGDSLEEIKALVQRLVAARKTLLESGEPL